MASESGRNVVMAQRIERTPVRHPFRFVVAGDSGAWPDPTADATFAQFVRQVAALDPPAAEEPHRIVLVHMPPHLGGRYAPHEDWGFKRREPEFLALLRAHRVGLVCCAHGLAFDRYVHDGIGFVMSGGGGTGLCSHLRGICTAGPGRPEDRGSLFHAVEIEVSERGRVSGRVLQAFAQPGSARLRFGADDP